MKWVRVTFLLLLCTMLSFSGLAATGLVGDCPMQQSMDTGINMSADMPGCDSAKSLSVDKAKAKGTACKITAQCQFGSLYHPTYRADVVRPAMLAVLVQFYYTRVVVAPDPNGLWRPPRLV